MEQAFDMWNSQPMVPSALKEFIGCRIIDCPKCQAVGHHLPAQSTLMQSTGHALLAMMRDFPVEMGEVNRLAFQYGLIGCLAGAVLDAASHPNPRQAANRVPTVDFVVHDWGRFSKCVHTEPHYEPWTNGKTVFHHTGSLLRVVCARAAGETEHDYYTRILRPTISRRGLFLRIDCVGETRCVLSDCLMAAVVLPADENPPTPVVSAAEPDPVRFVRSSGSEPDSDRVSDDDGSSFVEPGVDQVGVLFGELIAQFTQAGTDAQPCVQSALRLVNALADRYGDATAGAGNAAAPAVVTADLVTADPAAAAADDVDNDGADVDNDDAVDGMRHVSTDGGMRHVSTDGVSTDGGMRRVSTDGGMRRVSADVANDAADVANDAADVANDAADVADDAESIVSYTELLLEVQAWLDSWILIVEVLMYALVFIFCTYLSVWKQ